MGLTTCRTPGRGDARPTAAAATRDAADAAAGEPSDGGEATPDALAGRSRTSRPSAGRRARPRPRPAPTARAADDTTAEAPSEQ
jgi:hypothetical protein